VSTPSTAGRVRQGGTTISIVPRTPEQVAADDALAAAIELVWAAAYDDDSPGR
jgi:hypothetical protein